VAKRIGVLTAGGDAPGLNVCLKAIAYGAIDRGWEVVGLRKGWEGLLYFDPEDPDTHAANAMMITKSRIRDVDRLAGSFLHSSRLNPDSVIPEALPSCLEDLECGSEPVDTTEHIKRAVERLGLDVLVVLGDNAALNYAARLSSEGVPLIGVPKTVHNDVAGSDYSIGFSTALGRGVQFVHEVRSMAGSREEIAVVEVLGRSTGLVTLLTALLSGSDRSLIPEVPFDPEVLASGLVEDKRANPNNYAILTMSEVAHATAEQIAKYQERIPRLSETVAPGISGVGAVVTELLELLTDQRMIFQPLSLLIRTAIPDGQDLIGAVNLALLALNLVEVGRLGRLAAYRQHENYVDLPIDTVTEPGGNIDVAEHYDADAFRPKPSIMWASRI
jgi:6-phosphofructokinase 1